LLQQTVNGRHISIAAVVQHAAHHPIDALLEGSGQLLERLSRRLRLAQLIQPNKFAFACALQFSSAALAYTIRSAIFRRQVRELLTKKKSAACAAASTSYWFAWRSSPVG
jgi:hypothetical protein